MERKLRTRSYNIDKNTDDHLHSIKWSTDLNLNDIIMLSVKLSEAIMIAVQTESNLDELDNIIDCMRKRFPEMNDSEQFNKLLKEMEDQINLVKSKV